MIDDDPDEEYKQSMIASIKYYFCKIGRWLNDKCQIIVQNRFREVGVNGLSTFPRQDMITKLRTLKNQTLATETVSTFAAPMLVTPPRLDTCT